MISLLQKGKKEKKIAVLKITPVNFSIKDKESKEAITYRFQHFLNALDFPIQIMMNTESLDLQSYLDEIERKTSKNQQFKSLFTGYQSFLKETISKNNVLNRNFYLIIPEKDNIDIQVQICERRLYSMGLRSHRLKDNELNNLLNKFFNNPQSIFNNVSHIRINNTYNRIIVAHGYPRSVETGFLDRIVSCLGNFDFSLHIEPHNIETTMVDLNKELQKQSADLYALKLKGILNPSLEIKHTDTRNVLENLQKGKEKLFNISLYINCRASTLDELEILSKRVESELNSLMIIPKVPAFRMAQGFQSCAPLGMNKLKISRNITTQGLSAFFPFTSSFLQMDKTGVWLGLNKNNIPIIKDIFTLRNPNGICLATSGSGKSYMAKLLISRYLLNGIKVIVIDPQAEYRALTEKFGGQVIDLSRESNTIINPLDLMGHDYAEKRLSLMDLMPIMLGDLTEPQKSFIDKAITEAYEKRGINQEPKTWNNEPPTLAEVLQALKRMEKSAITLEKTTIRSLTNRLDMYVHGVFSFLNKQTKIDFDNPFVCFDIGNMPKQVKPVIMFLVLDYVYMKMKEDIERKLLVIDEAWSLLGRAHDASYIFEIVKTCRKFNLALFLINQEVEGMLESKAGKSVLANSAYTLLLSQKPAVINSIQNTFHLSDIERERLLTADVGEGLLLIEDEHSEIKIVASKEEHQFITTKPDELLIQKENDKNISKEKKKSPKKLVKITVDENKGFYKFSQLKKEEAEYLISKGYRKANYQNIHNEKCYYLIKPNKIESDTHFLLIHDIAEHIRKFTDKIELYQTVKPDLVFQVNNQKYAIEVETGKVLTKDKGKFSQKINALKEDYGNNWFFVLTNRKYSAKYQRFGETYTKLNIANKVSKLFKEVKNE